MKNKNKEGLFKEGLFIGVNLSKDIPITFESFNPNGNYNKILLGKPGEGMSYNIKMGITDIK